MRAVARYGGETWGAPCTHSVRWARTRRGPWGMTRARAGTLVGFPGARRLHHGRTPYLRAHRGRRGVPGEPLPPPDGAEIATARPKPYLRREGSTVTPGTVKARPYGRRPAGDLLEKEPHRERHDPRPGPQRPGQGLRGRAAFQHKCGDHRGSGTEREWEETELKASRLLAVASGVAAPAVATARSGPGTRSSAGAGGTDTSGRRAP